MPKLAGAFLLLALLTLASTMSYAGYLVVGVVADYLGIGRLMAALLLGILFLRLPWLREGKLRTVGLLPKRARLPVVVTLFVLCLLHFLYYRELIPMLFVGFAAAFLLTYRRVRRIIASQTISSLYTWSVQADHSKGSDNTVIDVEFREKKD